MSMMSVEIFEQMRHNMVEKSLYFSSTQLELHLMESFLSRREGNERLKKISKFRQIGQRKETETGYFLPTLSQLG